MNEKNNIRNNTVNSRWSCVGSNACHYFCRHRDDNADSNKAIGGIYDV